MTRLKTTLDRLYETYNCPDSATDPIQIVRRYDAPEDREIAGFCAAALAFGRVGSIMNSIDRLMHVMGPSPARFVREFDLARDRREFRHLVHRWTQGDDFTALVFVLKTIVDRAGSIERFFLEGIDESSSDLGPAIESFSRRVREIDLRPVYGRRRPRPGVSYFFPSPSTGSACKRMNLFLRWMVRSDRIDLGVWSRVSPARLIVPLDTHVVRVGRCLGLTRYTSPGWKMAVDITRALRELDPDDPIKYDFSLCHVGMMHRDEAALARFCRLNIGSAPRSARSAGYTGRSRPESARNSRR